MLRIRSDRSTFFVAAAINALAFITDVPAANYYISPTGNDANRCTNQTTDACATFPRCNAVMAAGDTCFAMDGVYIVSDTDPSFPRKGWVFRSPGGSPTARKRFTSFSQDPRKVIVKSATPRTQDTYYVLGESRGNQSDYLEFDHLTLEGRMEGGENLDGFTYHHNIARCPNIGTGGGNQAPIYLQEKILEMHKGIHIYNNLFLMDSSCDLPSSNLQFIVAFSFNGAIIENNDFVNSSSKPMFAFVILKRGNKDAVVRYNWFKGISGDPLGVWLMDCNGDTALNEFGDRSNQGGSDDCNNKVYQNVFLGLSSGAQCRSESGRREWTTTTPSWTPRHVASGSTLCIAEAETGTRSLITCVTRVGSLEMDSWQFHRTGTRVACVWPIRPTSTTTSTGRLHQARVRGRTADSIPMEMERLTHPRTTRASPMEGAPAAVRHGEVEFDRGSPFRFP